MAMIAVSLRGVKVVAHHGSSYVVSGVQAATLRFGWVKKGTAPELARCMRVGVTCTP